MNFFGNRTDGISIAIAAFVMLINHHQRTPGHFLTQAKLREAAAGMIADDALFAGVEATGFFEDVDRDKSFANIVQQAAFGYFCQLD